MGQRLCAAFAPAREVFAAASDVLGFSVQDVCFGDRTALLASTRYAQPVVFTCSMASLAVLADAGLTPDAVAGHSVGEFAALVAAGVVGFEDAIRSLAVRGALMQQTAPGAMAVVLGLPADDVVALRQKVSAPDAVVVGLYNGPTNVVVSGARAAVEEISALAKAAGALRVIAMATDRAFHSPLMEPVVAAWDAHLEGVTFRPPQLPVALCTTGRTAADPEEIRRATVAQLTSPVRWADVMDELVGLGMDTAVEVGESKTLCGFVRMLDRGLGTETTQDVRWLDTVVREGYTVVGHGATAMERMARVDTMVRRGGFDAVS